MIKRRLKRLLPSHDTFRKSRWLRWMDPWLGHPRLWHMHRRSVALGMAIGMITGLIPGPIQMISGALIAIPLRANIPAAVFATLYSNPVTFVPLYWVAFAIGQWVTGDSREMIALPQFEPTHWWTAIPDVIAWAASLGNTLLIGLTIQALVSAVLAYVLTMIGWRVAVSWAWRNRHRR
jgi:uncharacterized protein